MAMTSYEQAVHDELHDLLNRQGYHPYAVLLDDFDVVPFTFEDEQAIGYMVPDQGEIHICTDLDLDTASTVVRHEILHQYLDHFGRMAKHLGIDPSEMTVSEVMNIAGDYEISNVGYTEKDKQLLRNILLAGNTLRGLITSDDHPEWLNLDFEDIYDKLDKEQDKIEQQQKKNPQQQKQVVLHNIHGKLMPDGTFVDENGNTVTPIANPK